ncbi:MAG: serine/threonine protein kinase [Polyangiaceae bacterium]|nr:serine/threonine protein kinase [Polyangiaceae bacterium]
MAAPLVEPPLLVAGGKYALFERVSSGGMGSVHIGRMRGNGGFGRIVAIKRLHAHLAQETAFRVAFVDEARTASRIHHANVVQMLDVIEGDEVFLVMEFVHGDVLSRLTSTLASRKERMPVRIALGIMSQALQGLHAAHSARDESGHPLGVIHRDVSPQNILVGIDGIVRLIDFGVAKANGRLVTTEDGSVKGKIAYMAPEYLKGEDIGPSVDIFSAALVLWELLAGRRVYEGQEERQIVFMAVHGAVRKLSKVAPDISSDIEELVMRGLEPQPQARYRSAMEFASALESTGLCASGIEIGRWLQEVSESVVTQRAMIARVETIPSESLEDRAGERARRAREPHDEDQATVSHELEATPLLIGAGAPLRRRWPAWVGVAAAAVLCVAGVSAALPWGSNAPAAMRSERATAVLQESVLPARGVNGTATPSVSMPSSLRGAPRVAPRGTSSIKPGKGDGLFPRN